MSPLVLGVAWLGLFVLLVILVLLVVEVRAEVEQRAAALTLKLDTLGEELAAKFGALRKDHEGDVDAAVTVIGAQIARLDVKTSPAPATAGAGEEPDEEAQTQVFDGNHTLLSIGTPPQRRS